MRKLFLQYRFCLYACDDALKKTCSNLFYKTLTYVAQKMEVICLLPNDGCKPIAK